MIGGDASLWYYRRHRTERAIIVSREEAVNHAIGLFRVKSSYGEALPKTMLGRVGESMGFYIGRDKGES
jgi:hypothetical protein